MSHALDSIRPIDWVRILAKWLFVGAVLFALLDVSTAPALAHLGLHVPI